MTSPRSLSILGIIILASQLIISLSQKPYLTFPSNHKLKFTYGSCNRFYETDKSIIFNTIADYKPDIFAWLGDVAYVEDMVIFYLYFKFPGIEKARQRLEASKNDPSYASFRKSVPIVGVWDNHDYGCDGGAKDFPYKYEMKDAFLDFVDEPLNSPRRKRSGVYDSYTIKLGELLVNVVLLDVRFNKDPDTRDVLGEEQWKWLEEEFKKGEDLYLIGSGSQILPDDRILHDNWFGESTKRLLKLIRQYNISAILLTGDVHVAEIIPLPCSDAILGYQLYEVTSSGLTHTSRDHFHKGELFDKLFFPESYNKGDDRYVDWNFGSVEIEVDSKNKANTKIEFHIRALNGSVILQRKLTLGDLQRKSEPKIEIDSYSDSVCFRDSTKEQRFLKHFIKALTTKEIFLWLFPPIFGILAVVFLTLYGSAKFCCPRKHKIKSE